MATIVGTSNTAGIIAGGGGGDGGDILTTTTWITTFRREIVGNRRVVIRLIVTVSALKTAGAVATALIRWYMEIGFATIGVEKVIVGMVVGMVVVGKWPFMLYGMCGAANKNCHFTWVPTKAPPLDLPY